MRKQRTPNGACPAPRGPQISEEMKKAMQRAKQAQQWRAGEPREQPPPAAHALPAPGPAALASAIAANPPPQPAIAQDNLPQQQRSSTTAPSAHARPHTAPLPIAHAPRLSDQGAALEEVITSAGITRDTVRRVKVDRAIWASHASRHHLIVSALEQELLIETGWGRGNQLLIVIEIHLDEALEEVEVICPSFMNRGLRTS